MAQAKKFTTLDSAFEALPEETKRHSLRVAEYMQILFPEACFTEQLRRDQKAEARLRDDLTPMAYNAGKYHDIGKAMIPLELHVPRDDFSEEELALYRRHQIYSSKLAFDRFRADTKCSAREETYGYEAISCMHERWDGTGFPQGLEGNKIPVVARLLTACDALDHLACSIHSEKPFEDALDILMSKCDEIYDRLIVDLMFTIKGSLKKVFLENLEYTDSIPKIDTVVPASGKRTVKLRYRQIKDRMSGRTLGLEAVPMFRVGDDWKDYSGVSEILADTKEKQNKELRRRLFIYLTCEACDMIRHCSAARIDAGCMTVNYPAVFLKQKGAAQDIISVVTDEEIGPEKFRVIVHGMLFNQSSATLQKNITALKEAGIKTVLTCTELVAEPADTPKDAERMLLTADRVIESGISIFRLDRADAEKADDEAGVAEFEKLARAGIEFASDALDGELVRPTLNLLNVTEIGDSKNDLLFDEDEIIKRFLAAENGERDEQPAEETAADN